MGLSIRSAEVDRPAAEVSAMTGESKTEAIRVALAERKARLIAAGGPDKRARAMQFLEQTVWPSVRPNALGKPVSKREVEKLLGF